MLLSEVPTAPLGPAECEARVHCAQGPYEANSNLEEAVRWGAAASNLPALTHRHALLGSVCTA